MITASPTSRLSPPVRDWRELWRESFTDATALLAAVGLADRADLLPPDDAGFPLRVPRGFAARMRHGDPGDPLLLQVLPRRAEHDDAPGYSTDAVGDMASKAGHGILHKYDGRALLIASGSCAVNCRYCFRRHFPYGEEIAAAGQWREALARVREDTSIRELILSGGDPLSLATHKLEELTRGLAELPHVIRLRIHTRLPVVLPERVDDAFTDWLAAIPLQKVVVLHANHANEFDAAVDAACARLRGAGATVLNQAVLLRGINDEVKTLAALCERSFAAGVLPYYLHQLDRVQGAAHFEVDDDRAVWLVDALRAHLPGYLVPRLVRELPGDPSKRPIADFAR
ncbi:EF-P beta-lysylation protein EpmB [Luteibacter sp. UNC138MFCol5.1]|uniref:EF-P beta-lysylation protein EpmB n=1 Tax=Luteibacter sp. UNC138MFCol5.1 TaxID=1502774 RepID=UPI0008CB9AF1|nr:EF-P beta-lysylation protein EpmB [Luteibacter sp. UNC138MFCol5.1]SEO60381.1 EF-P beta-lysylation protein EpmB [Luteibacter sp. UNC138MFCol5.1]